MLNLATTLLMTGIIWFVQVVHYPLFSRVGRDGFAVYESLHSAATTWVVAPLMIVELVTALLLCRWPPAALPLSCLWVGFALAVAIWLATFFLSVPQHTLLAAGFNEEAHHALVATNWIRTALWSVRALLLLYLVARQMPEGTAMQ